MKDPESLGSDLALALEHLSRSDDPRDVALVEIGKAVCVIQANSARLTQALDKAQQHPLIRRALL
ncbi:MAG: hypothetical protein ACYDAY_11950 [Candidatus Dormibacteria bacterium]